MHFCDKTKNTQLLLNTTEKVKMFHFVKKNFINLQSRLLVLFWLMVTFLHTTCHRHMFHSIKSVFIMFQIAFQLNSIFRYQITELKNILKIATRKFGHLLLSLFYYKSEWFHEVQNKYVGTFLTTMRILWKWKSDCTSYKSVKTYCVTLSFLQILVWTRLQTACL